MKRFLKGAAMLLMAGAVVATWYVHELRSGPGPRTADVVVTGVSGPVEVLRDSLGVPHIWAETVEDAFYAQGYLHASDRLWQMELFRRTATGTLSEVLGEAALPADRFLRTLGLSQAAERSLQAVDPETRQGLEAYSRGVNAAVEGWRGPLPPEFVLLRARPGQWLPHSSTAMEKIMAWDLAEYGTSLTLARARESLSDEDWALVRPEYPEWGVTIVGDAPPPERRQSGSAGPPSRDRVSASLLSAAEIPELAQTLLDAASTVRASNSWVLGGARSRSGKPLLANDMHLGLNHPNIWYLVGLHAPGMDVVGMSLPGSPGVVAGHSRAVAWGFTNATVDDSDFFIERLDPADSSRYLTPDGSEAFRVRRELIRLKDGRLDTLIVRETRHGPVITPVESRAGPDLLAFSWVAHHPATTAQAIPAMNQATTAAEFVEALEVFSNPHQNVVFADTAGAWGYWMVGRVPLRRSGAPPYLPVPGWTGEYDWEGWLAFDEHPHVLSPSKGYVATANNRQSWSPGSERVTDGTWASPYRAQRISELIEANGRHDAESMRAIQMDVRSAFVERYRAAAAEAFRAAGADSLAGALEAWDGEARQHSREATLFFSWIEQVRASLRRAAYGEDRGYMPMRAVARALDGAVQESAELARAAAEESLGQPSMPWGEAHQLTFGHPLAGVPVVSSLLGFGKGPLPREGSPHAVNVAGYSGSRPPFRVTHGPSQRHVVDMADPDGTGGFMLPGGQSGLPDHPHSWDQLERWQRGELWRLPLARDVVETRTVSRFRLVPEG
jgi:penicillin amidase